jgi:polar amino acid transport system permease protein
MTKNSGRGSFDGATPSESRHNYDFGGEWSPSAIELNRRAVRKQRNKRSALIAALSSFLVLGTLTIVIVTSPGYETLRNTFFKWAYGFEILPKVILGFGTNAALTVIAGTSVAVLGLCIALLRTSRSPALTPFRFLATVYVDVFRGIPMILVILLVGFGIPALQIRGRSYSWHSRSHHHLFSVCS